MAGFKTISTNDLSYRLEQGGNFHFWNVLNDDYFTGELIPGSHRVPVDQLEQEVEIAKVPKDAELVVYCAGPHCPASRNAAEKLVQLGFTNVTAYEGGLEEWKAAGHEVEQLKDTA